MPKIEDLTKKSADKFQKSTYRPWNFIEQLETESLKKDTIVEILSKNIIRWKYKDRPENELGDIDDLAETFKAVGQQQPCIVRKSTEKKDKYELLVGERRWKAAEKANIPLKVIIKDIDDKTAALIQAIENEKRKDISEFSRGMSYSYKIEKGIISQKDLIEILGISKLQVSRLLSYSKIPKNLFEEVSDFRKVSSRTAAEIVRLANQDETNINIIIQMSDKIRNGLYGARKIEQELLKIKNGIDNKKITIFNKDNEHMFTMLVNKKNQPTIVFSKQLSEKIVNEVLIEMANKIKDFIIEKDL